MRSSTSGAWSAAGTSVKCARVQACLSCPPELPSSEAARAIPDTWKWRMGLLGLMHICGYHQGGDCFIKKHPWEGSECLWTTSESDPDTAPRSQFSRTLQPMAHHGTWHAEQEACRGMSVSLRGRWFSCPVHLPPQCIQSSLEGHMTVTTGVLTSLVKGLYLHQKYTLLSQ